MTAAEAAAARRRELLGDDVIAYIDAEVDATPEPEAGGWIDELRRIFTSSAAPESPASSADAA
ncbi:hypothetical protein ACFYRN_36345 [Streptomyces sp. NPDC005227]|uniref:hypothetical protein n=1 Tax=Streptomyces sp. NPDC005227 TaxID=3364707 RepID=UPI0036A9EA63